MTATLVLYHDKCADGFAAAWAVWKALGDTDVEYRPVRYEWPAPMDVEGKDVIIVDFSYPADVLRKMGESARSVVVLDHHESAEKELIQFRGAAVSWSRHRSLVEMSDRFSYEYEYTRDGKVHVIYNPGRAGALLAWSFFHFDEAPPDLIRHVDDLDRWQFKLHETREVHAAIMSYTRDFASWDALHKVIENYRSCNPNSRDIGLYETLISEGSAILRNNDLLISEFLEDVMTMTIAGYTVPVVNVPKAFASDAAGKLSEGHPFGASYYDSDKGRIFSLRRREGDLHLGDLVKKHYGGGGHPAAAGFIAPHGWTGWEILPLKKDLF